MTTEPTTTPTTSPVATSCGAPKGANPTIEQPIWVPSLACSYSTLRPADAVAHLGESIAAEIERFERDCGLKVATIKLKRGGKDEPDVLKSVACHVRS